ncbi:hypothetical protein [Actinoplanes sp. NPDC049681]|uniref:hypothetical protein n=1 Tax=Actinoplanes sp. NPDC049681 TaxID=3363905 RepID=UPI003790B5F2
MAHRREGGRLRRLGRFLRQHLPAALAHIALCMGPYAAQALAEARSGRPLDAREAAAWAEIVARWNAAGPEV